ncbi:MAG TPA: DUF4232 domain-containing protein [Streptosporangiaceae bacterium]|nr:DUF4232 domain-containing protein [Streptosporangiaceae bacterium]
MKRANLTVARRALLVAAAIAPLAACGTSAPPGSAAPSGPSAPASPSPAATSVPAASVSTCRTPGLRVTLTHSGAAGGIVGGYIGFTNTSAAPCRLSGWPTMIAATATGSTATAKHLVTTMFGPSITAPPQVTLDPGGVAEAVFTASENAGPCGSGSLPTYRTIRVAPPGDARSVTISAWLAAVDTYLPACGGFSVSPVVRSSALPVSG